MLTTKTPLPTSILTHNQRADSHHTLVHSPRGPSGPAAFGGACHNKLADIMVELLFQERGGRVQRPNRSFGHWQAQEPLRFIWVLVKMMPRERNDRVLIASRVQRISLKSDGFVGDLFTDKVTSLVQNGLFFSRPTSK